MNPPPPPFTPRLFHLRDDPALDFMVALDMAGEFERGYLLLGERWQVEIVRDLLTRYLETGETAGEIDYLAEELGHRWLTVPDAVALAKRLTDEDIPCVTIRTAARTGHIRKAKKAGRDWTFAQMRFLQWLRNRPKPGPKVETTG